MNAARHAWRTIGLLLAAGSIEAWAGTALADEPSLSPSPTEAPAQGHTAGPWIVVGSGGGVAAIGILSFVGAVKAHSDAQAEAAAKGCSTSPVACPAGVDASHLSWLVNGEHAMNVIGAVMTAAGGAAVVAGLVWHFGEPTRGRAGVAIQPEFGPREAGMSVVGRF